MSIPIHSLVQSYTLFVLGILTIFPCTAGIAPTPDNANENQTTLYETMSPYSFIVDKSHVIPVTIPNGVCGI